VVLVAYHISRGPGGELPDVPGLLPRSEFGLEILVTLAFEVVIVGLSMDISSFGVLLQTLVLPPPTGSMLDVVLLLPETS